MRAFGAPRTGRRPGRVETREMPRRRWYVACAAASTCLATKHAKSAADTPASVVTVRPMPDLMPRPAAPPFEPPPLPSLVTESTRRILWIVGLYRAVCGALLLGVALLLDLRTMSVGAPKAFIPAAGWFFLYALAAFLWVQREAQVRPLPILLLSLLGGD